MNSTWSRTREREEEAPHGGDDVDLTPKRLDLTRADCLGARAKTL